MSKKAEQYTQRARSFQAQAEQLEARSRLVSNLRGLSFAVMVVAGLFALFGRDPELMVPISLIAAVCFVGLVIWHARVIESEDHAKRWVRVNEDAEGRSTGKWRRFPEDGSQFQKLEHPYAEDLDLVGQGSLFQRINVAHTRFGHETLYAFLSRPAKTEVVKARQAAVRALAPELELRQSLEALSLAVVDRPTQAGQRQLSRSASGQALYEPPDPEPLLRWAEAEPTLAQNSLVRIAARLMPPLTLTGLVLHFGFGWPLFWFTLPLLVQLGLVLKTRELTAQVFGSVSGTQGAFLRYGAMLELIEKIELPSEHIQALQRELLSGEQQGESAAIRPSMAMKEFRSKVGWFDLKHNGLIHPVANLLLLWDLNCVIALERWQRRSGRAARGWFRVLGEFEALSSFAGLAYDEPSFVFPLLESGPAHFVATGLGHPLLDAERRVVNDVAIEGPGQSLLITGSNMSGKSTFLRAMGLAAVMAQAGAPVCASSLRMSQLLVRSSIRVKDSLEGGVSHFYAELHKLKAVVESTEASAPVLFLLDEVLHGTNSRERQIGARWVIRAMLERGAVGAVTTHDMGLCELPEPLMQQVTQVHFRESVQDDKMTFDYKLRPGPVTAGNALRLMQLVGLPVPLE